MEQLQKEIKSIDKLARGLTTKLASLSRFRSALRDEVYHEEVSRFAVAMDDLAIAMRDFARERRRNDER